MKTFYKLVTLLLGLIFFSPSMPLYAGIPLWSFTPLTPTTLSIPANGTALVQYVVTNNSLRSHTLMMTPMNGISQITTGPGVCGNPFLLATKGASCILSLQINASQLVEGHNVLSPTVCSQSSSPCYRPSPMDILVISVTPKQNSYTVGGAISGLTGTVVLQNNGADTLSISTDGAFTFPTPLADGSSYSVTVATQPTTQTCTVNNATGTINGANVVNVAVVCSTNTHTVGGTVSGLSGTVILENNGTDPLSINSDGSFTFPTPLAQGSTYNVTVQTQPPTQICSVANGSGTIGTTDVTDVTVTCSTQAHNVGGTVSGLNGTVILENNGADPQSISVNGGYTFSIPVAEGATYNVTVATQPLFQTCSVANGSGTMGTVDVTNADVTCVTNNTTLSVDSHGVIPVNAAPGSITVTNTGTTYTAYNVSATLPGGWTNVTQDASNCASIAPNGGTCTLNFGSTAPYVAQANIVINGDNITSPPTTALAFSMSDYLVYAVTPTTALVVDSADATGSPIHWSPTNNNINLSSCNTNNDGACNTPLIVAFYNATSLTTYAAGLCYGITTDNSGSVSQGTWFLPAICQLGVGTACSGSNPNIESNLIIPGFLTLVGIYASSSQWTTPTLFIWIQQFSALNSQSGANKTGTNKIRCSREFSY